MEAINLPALYNSASELSATSQRKYLKLIRLEYSSLIVASILSLNISNNKFYYIIHALVFLFSLAFMITRYWTKPEQDWYKGRALAESIKTSSWRYCMRAEPFDGEQEAQITRANFRNYLKAILEANRHIGERIPPDSDAEDQITTSMEEIRSLSLDKRINIYIEHRIKEQRKWYAQKSKSNKDASYRWLVGGVSAYFLAIFLLFMRASFPDFEIWPIEPFAVIASSIIGWTQVKKFNELASSYTLTAHEIGIIQCRSTEVSTETQFSDFVNEAEQAFSREHTQWVARQQSH